MHLMVVNKACLPSKKQSSKHKFAKTYCAALFALRRASPNTFINAAESGLVSHVLQHHAKFQQFSHNTWQYVPLF